MERDEKYMKRCLELAARAKENGKPAVGSLVVCGEEIVGEGIEGDPSLPGSLAHAEVLALLDAEKFLKRSNLSDCELYTTVEPCFMCSYQIRRSKIRRVVFGTTTPEAGGYSSLFPFLKSNEIGIWGAAPEIKDFVLRKACEDLLRKK